MYLYYSIYFLIICLLIVGLYYLVIPYLKKVKIGQFVREEGPRNHYIKKGTPTMGGIVMFLSYLIIFASFLLLFKHHFFIDKQYKDLIMLVIPTIGFCFIGFIDDLLIILKRNNKGLNPILKIILQLIFSVIIYILFLYLYNDTSINFFGYNFDLQFMFGPFLVLIFLSCCNSTNLTDGLDGLLTLTTIPILIGFIIIGYFENNNVVVLSSVAFLTVLIAFLFFNFPKASIFMGDTGSFLIGAYIASVTLLLKIEILLLIFGFVYIFETLSVIIQVWYFKKTKGKRIFKMTPFHHHLELCGWSEMKIGILYFIISLIFTIIGVILEVKLF